VALLGRVEAPWRYPVESMQGEACRAPELDRRGVTHDRTFALRTKACGLVSRPTGNTANGRRRTIRVEKLPGVSR